MTQDEFKQLKVGDGAARPLRERSRARRLLAF